MARDRHERAEVNIVPREIDDKPMVLLVDKDRIAAVGQLCAANARGNSIETTQQVYSVVGPCEVTGRLHIELPSCSGEYKDPATVRLRLAANALACAGKKLFAS